MTPRSAVPIVWPERAVRYGSESHAQCCVTKRVKIQDCWCNYAAVCFIVRKNISSNRSSQFGEYKWSREPFSCIRMSGGAFKQWGEQDMHTQTHTYIQILSSLALQTGEDAAQVSLDRAIKWIDHSTASVNSSSPARTEPTVSLKGNREVRTRGGVEIGCGRKYPNFRIRPVECKNVMQLSTNYESRPVERI